MYVALVDQNGEEMKLKSRCNWYYSSEIQSYHDQLNAALEFSRAPNKIQSAQSLE